MTKQEICLGCRQNAPEYPPDKKAFCKTCWQEMLGTRPADSSKIVFMLGGCFGCEITPPMYALQVGKEHLESPWLEYVERQIELVVRANEDNVQDLLDNREI